MKLPFVNNADWQEIAEYPLGAPASSPNQSYVFGSYIDEVLMVYRPNAEEERLKRLFYSTNDLYSVYALTDSNGTVVERYMYDPYGKVTVLDANGTPRTVNESLYGNPLTFTGRRLDGETGLLYFRNRMYDVGLGRFVSRDPAGYVDGMGLQGAYFIPIEVDPSGLGIPGPNHEIYLPRPKIPPPIPPNPSDYHGDPKGLKEALREYENQKKLHARLTASKEQIAKPKTNYDPADTKMDKLKDFTKAQRVTPQKVESIQSATDEAMYEAKRDAGVNNPRLPYRELPEKIPERTFLDDKADKLTDQMHEYETRAYRASRLARQARARGCNALAKALERDYAVSKNMAESLRAQATGFRQLSLRWRMTGPRARANMMKNR